MKVSIEHTVEVSDTQRVQVANVLDGKVSKRQATRVELKQFIWVHGESWEDDLAVKWADDFGDGDDTSDEPLVHAEEPDDEDLI